MSKVKIHPEKYRLVVRKQRQPQASGSFSKINSSYLHESYNTESVSVCKTCNQHGDNLMVACDCPKEHYHPNCFKQELKERIKEAQNNLEEKPNYKYLKCRGCGHKIKCKFTNKYRCKSCCQACSTANERCCQFSLFIFFMIVFTACVITMILLASGTLDESGLTKNMQKSALMIALGIVVSLLLIFVIYCFLDCMVVTQINIETLYDHRQRYKGINSQRSGKSRKKSGASEMVVQEIQ